MQGKHDTREGVTMIRILSRIGAVRAMIALGVFSVAGVVPLSAQGTAANADAQEIQQVISAEQLEEQTCCLAPLAYRTTVQALPAVAVQSMQVQISSDVGTLYSGPLRNTQTTLLQRAASVQGEGSIEVAGGVDSINITHLSIEGTTATATGNVTKWLKSLVGARDGSSQPLFGRATNDFTDTLARTPDGWRITAESITPAPGEGMG